MIDGYKVVTITPAGRIPFLEILFPYLLQNRHVIDKHIFYLNPADDISRNYIISLGSRYKSFVEIIQGELPYNWWRSVYPMYKYCCDEDTIYIKIDDDVCYIGPDSIEKLVRFRIAHPEFFLVFPVIVNNNMDIPLGIETKSKFQDFLTCLSFGLEKHWKFFFHYPNYLEKFCKFDYMALSPQRIMINCVSWFGRDFAKFGGVVPEDDEVWLTIDKTADLRRQNAVTANAIVCHFAFSWQQQIMAESGLLEEYKKLAPGTPIKMG